jgi:hypothetical protein
MLTKMVSVGCGTTVIASGTGLIFAPGQELKCIRTPTGFLTTLCHSLLIMAELSPAAQAVLNAFYVKVPMPGSQRLAAALRAAADQVVPHLEEPDWGACNNGHCDIELYTDHQRKRAQLLAIAAELANTSPPS